MKSGSEWTTRKDVGGIVSGGTFGPFYTRRHGLKEYVQLAASISASTLGAEALVWLAVAASLVASWSLELTDHVLVIRRAFKC